MGLGRRLFVHSLSNYATKVNWNWLKRSLVRCSRRPKRGDAIDKTKRDKGSKVMVVAEAYGWLLAVAVASGFSHEVTLVEATPQNQFVDEIPELLIDDRVYDNDPLDQRLTERGIELITPHRQNHQKLAMQDARCLWRYRRRWKIERFWARLQNHRRLVVRHERHAGNYHGFVRHGCLLILARVYL